MGVKIDSGALSRSAALNPGPGNYNPDYRATVASLPKFSIKGRYAERPRM